MDLNRKLWRVLLALVVAGMTAFLGATPDPETGRQGSGIVATVLFVVVFLVTLRITKKIKDMGGWE